MRLTDYLNAFSVEDLRELAARRRVRLSPEALQGRQTLVRTLASSLGQYESVYATVSQLNQAELGALRFLLQPGRTPGLSALAATAQADAPSARSVLESLRLWGLVFPEGDWEHVALPPSTQLAANYLNARAARKDSEPLRLAPPALESASGPTE